MNILIITTNLPYPLDSGGAQAQFNMIESMRHKHQIAILYTEDGHNRHIYAQKLHEQWPNVSFKCFPYIRQMLYPRFVWDKAVRAFKLLTMPHSNRFEAERALKQHSVYFTKDFTRFVCQAINEEKADIVQVEFFPAMHIVEYLPKHVRKIFVQHEIRFVRNERLLSRIQLTSREKEVMQRVKTDEIADMNSYDDIITLTDVDKDTLEKEGVNVPIHVSPAAVNTPLSPYHEWNGSLVFVGAFYHHPNQEGMDWFMSQVAPLISNLHLPLKIVGKGWPESYGNSPHLQVSLEGFVKNLPSVASGSIMIVPVLTGSGMRMKIIEAAAMCLPIVTTTVGAEGISVADGESCLKADTPQAFAQAIRTLATDTALRQSLAKQAQTIFIKEYSLDSLCQRRNQIYEKR